MLFKGQHFFNLNSRLPLFQGSKFLIAKRRIAVLNIGLLGEGVGSKLYFPSFCTSDNLREPQKASENLREPQKTSENLKEPQRTTDNLREAQRGQPIANSNRQEQTGLDLINQD